MPWYVAATKGITSKRTKNAEVIKLLEPITFIKVLALKRMYYQVEGPFNEWWEAKEAAVKYHLESGNVGGRHKAIRAKNVTISDADCH